MKVTNFEIKITQLMLKNIKNIRKFPISIKKRIYIYISSLVISNFYSKTFLTNDVIISFVLSQILSLVILLTTNYLLSKFEKDIQNTSVYNEFSKYIYGSEKLLLTYGSEKLTLTNKMICSSFVKTMSFITALMIPLLLPFILKGHILLKLTIFFLIMIVEIILTTKMFTNENTKKIIRIKRMQEEIANKNSINEYADEVYQANYDGSSNWVDTTPLLVKMMKVSKLKKLKYYRFNEDMSKMKKRNKK